MQDEKRNDSDPFGRWDNREILKVRKIFGIYNSAYVFVGVMGLFGFGIIFLTQLPITAKVLIVLALWWIALGAASVFTAFSYFEDERDWITHVRTSGMSPWRRVVSVAILCFIYWPIYLPKTPTIIVVLILVTIFELTTCSAGK